LRQSLAYVAFLVLSATGNASLGMFLHAMLWFIIPLSVIAIALTQVAQFGAKIKNLRGPRPG
jgi:hypothetical protein